MTQNLTARGKLRSFHTLLWLPVPGVLSGVPCIWLWSLLGLWGCPDSALGDVGCLWQGEGMWHWPCLWAAWALPCSFLGKQSAPGTWQTKLDPSAWLKTLLQKLPQVQRQGQDTLGHQCHQNDNTGPSLFQGVVVKQKSADAHWKVNCSVASSK